MNQILKNKAFSLIELSIVILIIGILIAGVTQATRLVSNFRLTTARTLTESSPVAGTKDLALWLETTSEKSFDDADSSEGVGITNWYDINPQSTSKKNAQQNTSASRPIYKANCINGLPCLTFDGTATYIDTLSNIFNSTAGVSVFVVAKPTAVGANDSCLICANDAGNFRLKRFANGYAYQVAGGTNYDGGTLNPDTSYVISLVDSGILAYIYSNGVSTETNGITSTGSTTSITATLAIGDVSDGVDRGLYYRGHIAEVIVFTRALKADERKAIESYLGKKWGIAVTN
ncbi:MAG: LamG-like jellyroll fold domain-containing protein [Rickettsiales bacterium]|nr:LamG-like jellyroll fold domain-containing protein [Rickettsiales bacterium]